MVAAATRAIEVCVFAMMTGVVMIVTVLQHIIPFNTQYTPPQCKTLTLHRELADLGTAFAHMGGGVESLLLTTAECGAQPPTAMSIVSGRRYVYI